MKSRKRASIGTEGVTCLQSKLRSCSVKHVFPKSLVVFAVLSSLTAGCSSTGSKLPPPRPDPALEALQRSAREIQASWNAIGALDKGANPDAQQVINEDQGVFGPGLSKLITLRYSGDLRAATVELSNAAQAVFQETGMRPPTAIPIHIEVENKPIGQVLRDIGYQAGRRAGIRLGERGGKEVVELIYVTGAN